MSALTSKRFTLKSPGTIESIALPLAAGFKAWTNGVACKDTANPGAVYPSRSGSTTLVPIGLFQQDVDNSAGSASVPVATRLNREVKLTWLENDTGSDAITVASHLLSNQYLLDDHTVTAASAGNSHSGTIWVVDAQTGQVGVEFPFS